MIDSAILSLYIGTLIVVYITPGPDMALILAVSAGKGRRSGFSTAKGFAIARAFHVLGSGAGLAVLFTTYPGLQTAVRVLGALYLLNWAWKIYRDPVKLNQSPPPAAREGSDLWRGFLTNLLNPKAVLFCSMLLPQFVVPGHGALFSQFMVLGLLLVVIGLVFDSSFVLLADWLTRSLHRNMPGSSRLGVGVQRCRNYLMIGVLGGMAVFLLKA